MNPDPFPTRPAGARPELVARRCGRTQILLADDVALVAASGGAPVLCLRDEAGQVFAAALLTPEAMARIAADYAAILNPPAPDAGTGAPARSTAQ